MGQVGSRQVTQGWDQPDHPPPHPASDNGDSEPFALQLEKLGLVIQEGDVHNQSYFETWELHVVT